MFVINSSRGVWLSTLTLIAGPNAFTSRRAIPAELWPRLDHFRKLGLLEFEGAAEAGSDAPTLSELTERQLYDMPKAELAELARASGVALAVDASKKDAIDALTAAQKVTP